jgi:hypothetical protein
MKRFAALGGEACFRLSRQLSWSFRRIGRSRPPAFLSVVHAFLHGFRQLLLVVCQKRFNLMMRFVTNGVDLRTEIFPRERRILIHQGLNFVVVLLE